MGNDGGSFSHWREVVKTKKKFKWKGGPNHRTCSLSGLPLSKPIVIDWNGNLMNKLVLIEKLLKKEIPNEVCKVWKLS